MSIFPVRLPDLGAFFNDDLEIENLNFNYNSMEAFANKILANDNMDDLDNLLSPPPSSNSSPSRDSDFDLPDLETPMDFLKFFDSTVDPLMSGISNFGDNTLCEDFIPLDKRQRKVSCSKDPFMGHRDNDQEFGGVDSPLGSDSILGQLPLLENLPHIHPSQTTYFSAWGHTPNNDDEDEPLLPLGSNNGGTCTSYLAEPEEADALPDTPSSHSGTITGDDSDVDIETIPDTPQSIELCGYSSSNDSNDLSPSLSPLPYGHKVSILQRCSSSIGSSSSKSLLRYGVSSSASLAENLMSGRSISGSKKRKHKDKHSTKSHTTTQHTTTYHHTYYPTGNSVNFHDYAMSPTSDMLETAQPTVTSPSSGSSNSSKRLYKRRHINPLDLSDKEKQNHHNQLERNRRQKLADLFIDLRDEVPTISQSSKASKVMILNQATNYIEDLQRLQKRQEDSLARELHRKEFLKKQLRQLEASLSRH